MSGSPAFFLGVDGGNSKTIAAIATEAGKVIAVARGGGSDIYARESPDAAINEICAVVTSALSSANVPSERIAASAFSLAGADWPEDFELLGKELPIRLRLTHSPTVVNDSLGALRSGAPTWEGVAVACGTFNAICARNRDGRLFHLGFWPDQRSGFDLGLATLKAVYREGFNLGPKTALSSRVLAHFGAKDARDLMHRFTRREDRVSMKEVNRLTPILLDVADEGDPVARDIVLEAGKVLGGQAVASARHVGLPLAGTNIVLTGGVLEHPSPLLASAIMSCLPGAIPLRAKVPPVVGALLLSFDAKNIPMSADRLAPSLTTQLSKLGSAI